MDQIEQIQRIVYVLLGVSRNEIMTRTKKSNEIFKLYRSIIRIVDTLPLSPILDDICRDAYNLYQCVKFSEDDKKIQFEESLQYGADLLTQQEVNIFGFRRRPIKKKSVKRSRKAKKSVKRSRRT